MILRFLVLSLFLFGLIVPASAWAAAATKALCNTDKAYPTAAQMKTPVPLSPRTSKNFYSQDENCFFMDVANTRSGAIYGSVRRLLYIYSGLGIAALAVLSFMGKFQWKWLFAYAAGLFIMAAGQAIVNFLN